MLKVKGEINGFGFRTSLFPTGKGGHILLINKRMQAGARVVLGSTAQFRLEPDTEERIVTVPVELKRILAGDRSFRRWFDQLNYSTQKYVADWITDVKSAEARRRRAEQVAEQLLSTMEAEQELPPVLQTCIGLRIASPVKAGSHVAVAAARPSARYLLLSHSRVAWAAIEKALNEAIEVARRKEK